MVYDLFDYVPMDYTKEEFFTIVKEIRCIICHYCGIGKEIEIPEMYKKEIMELKKYIEEKIINLVSVSFFAYCLIT